MLVSSVVVSFFTDVLISWVYFGCISAKYYLNVQLIEKVLDEFGYDLDSAIRCLTELRLGSSDVSIAGKLNGEPLSALQHETPGMYYE